MPTNHPDPEVTRVRTAGADATSPPNTTSPLDITKVASSNPPAAALVGHPYPFLSPPTHPDDLGQLGPYRVVKLLGEGGMGFVFRGDDDALRRPVALKVMRPEVAAGENARERFLREGRAAAAVKSDHVVTIYQVGEANGVPFLAMEFLAGATLDDWLKGRGGSAAAAVIVKVAKDTLRGLGAAHDRGLIHRDIKPANLWLEADTGRVKVLDFGLTRGSGAGDVLTREGALVGTPAYMAPEQAAGRPVDPRADLFSVGVVMYQMAAGRNPFQRGDVWATLTALAVDMPPPAGSVAAGLPHGLGVLIDRLVAKNPADRPASARAALAELAEVDRAMKGGSPVTVPAVNAEVSAPPVAAEPNPWAAVTEAVTEVDTTWATRPETDTSAVVPRWSVAPLAAGLLGLAVMAAVVVGLVIAMWPPADETVKVNPPPVGKTGQEVTPPPTTKTPDDTKQGIKPWNIKPPEGVYPPPPSLEKLLPPRDDWVKPWPLSERDSAHKSPFKDLERAKIPDAERVGGLPTEAVAVLGHRDDRVCGPDVVPVAAGIGVYTFNPTMQGWVLENGALVPTPDKQFGDTRMYGTTVAPWGSTVAGIDKDYNLRVFSPEIGLLQSSVIGVIPSTELFPNRRPQFAWDPYAKHLIAASANGNAYKWAVYADPPTKKIVGQVSVPDRASTLHLAVSRCGTVLSACDPLQTGGGPRLLEIGADKGMICDLKGVPGEFATSSQFRSDGKLLVAFRKDNEPFRVRLYDLEQRHPVPEQQWEFTAPRSEGGGGAARHPALPRPLADAWVREHQCVRQGRGHPSRVNGGRHGRTDFVPAPRPGALGG